MTMKLTAAPILRRFGFRQVLLVNAFISGSLMAAIGAFTAHTPHLMIIGVLLVGGFFRSLQFTSLNTLGYADVPDDQLSQATGFVAVVQQLSLSAGVAVAALLLGASRAAEGRTELVAADFAHGFVGIALLSLSAVALFWRLSPEAGAEVSGHVHRARTPQAGT
jgi:hypothetical protein